MKPTPSADPSMEQILADIRERITADIREDSVVAAARPAMPKPAAPAERGPSRPVNAAPPPPVPPAGSPDRVVELRPRQAETGDEAAANAAPAGSSGAVRPEPRFGFTLRREEPATRPQAAQPMPRQPSASERPAAAQPASAMPRGGAPIMSADADASVSRAFNHLADTLLSNEARTLEDLVREMLRPMLKSWLDANLPPMVERLVRQEIERVARGQRGA